MRQNLRNIWFVETVLILVHCIASNNWLKINIVHYYFYQFSIHPPTPPELDEHGHVPMKRLSSFAQSPQDDDSETDTDQCRLPDNGPRLPADGHSSTDAMLPTEEAQHLISKKLY